MRRVGVACETSDSTPVYPMSPTSFPTRCSRFSLVVLAWAASWSVAAPLEVWVAPDGRAGAAGTITAPLGSVAEAVRTVRNLRRTRDPVVAEGARIVLRGGTYALSETLTLRPEDSGTAAAPLVITAADGETPTLSGGVSLTGWQVATALPARMVNAAAGPVWVAEVPRFQGRPLEFRQLWINGNKAVRARYPDGDGMYRLVNWNKDAQEAEIPLRALGGVREVQEVEMVLHQMWEIAVLRLRTVTGDGGAAWVTFEEPEGPIQFEHPWPPPVIDAARPERNSAFFLANAPEYLTAPGEWWLDRAAERVYYRPRPGETPGTIAAVVPVLETLVRIAGSEDTPVRHLSFEGIHFAHTTWLRPSQVGHVPHQATMYMTEAYKLTPRGTPDWRSLDNQAWVGRPPGMMAVAGAEALTVRDCRFEHGAMAGLDLERAVTDSVVEGCVFSDLGGNGLQAGFYGDAATEVHLPYRPRDERSAVARVMIRRNRVDDTANEDWGGVGLSVGFAHDMTLEHNVIVSTSYSGISVGWGWTRTPNVMHRNIVRANRIHRFGTRNADTAGIYMLGAQPGSLVAENAIDTPRFSEWVHDPNHWGYVYLDEGSSFTTVRDNWSPTEKFIQNANGPGNVWENNGPMVAEAIRDAAGAGADAAE